MNQYLLDITKGTESINKLIINDLTLQGLINGMTVQPVDGFLLKFNSIKPVDHLK